MIVGLGLLVVLVLTAVAVGTALSRRRHRDADAGAGAGVGAGGEAQGSGIRRFFQYLLLAGLLFASASGVTGLLGRLLDRDDVLVEDEAALALQLTFTLIALPLWALLARWTWRRLHTVPAETRSAGWAVYLTAVGLVSLLVAITGWHEALAILVVPGRDGPGSAFAQALVWSLVWGLHHWWGPRITPREHLRPLHLVGSLIGLVTAATGLVRLVSSALRIVLGLEGESIVDTTTPLLLDGGIVFAVGAAAWVAYWWRRAVRDERDTPWLALVLLAGVGGGLVAAIAAASLAGYSVLVWLVGDPRATGATEHFDTLPGQVATALVGIVVWWYHRALLDAESTPGRTEVRRVYEYLLAAIGLLAAGSGLVVLVVTVVEAIAVADVLAGASAVNTLLGALVLLAVGMPLWWRHWSRAQLARSEQAAAEVVSPTRRAYLLLLFGVMGLTSVVTVMTLVYLVLQDALASGVDVETLRSVRFALGILVTTSLLAAYHWTIFRTDRDDTEELERAGALPARAARAVGTVPPSTARRRRVLLVGAADGAAAELRGDELELELVRRTDIDVPGASVGELREALATYPDGDLLLLEEPDGLRVVPIQRER
ncbi:DUF5671 domain-containing protein [Knoellia locipacati]|uniref:DUF5671 domain-containing protein n=1 Tax=Knoellia locipacati TaxID=882824 RepID=UPI00384EA64F